MPNADSEVHAHPNTTKCILTEKLVCREYILRHLHDEWGLKGDVHVQGFILVKQCDLPLEESLNVLQSYKQKMYGSNEPGFLGWYLKPKSWGEGNTKSYQRNIDLMWFVVSQAIRFFFQALLWYPFVGALIEPTKMRSEAPGCTYSTRSTTNHWIERQSNNR